MNNPLRTFLSALLVATALPCAAQSTGHFVDAAQFDIDPGPETWGIGGVSNEIRAQTFTVEWGGRLAGVMLPLACVPGGTLVVEIRRLVGDLPTGALIASAIVPGGLLRTGNFGFKYIEIPGAVAMVPGQRAGVIASIPGGSCDFNKSPVAASYPGGRAYFKTLGMATFVPFGSSPARSDDYPFQIVFAD